MSRRSITSMGLLLGLSLLPQMALASVSDMDYVVSGGFTTYVNAFTRLKYIFNDSEFSALVVSCLMMSIPIGMIIMIGRGSVTTLTGQKGGLNFGWVIMWLMGTIVYRGLMMPTSTLHIYDQDRNLYQPVSGIPSVIVMAAGFTNKVSQVFRDISSRNTASTTRTFGEGTPIKMLSALISQEGTPFDPYLKKNISELWHSCADIASQTNSGSFDRSKVITGSNRLLDDLAPLANPAVYTVWYSDTSPYEVTKTCADAYTLIKSKLNVSATTSGSPYAERVKSVCEKTGFSSTNATQLAECATHIEDAVKDIYGDSGLTLAVASQNVMIAQSINDSLLADNPNAALKQLVNRSMINSGIADATGSPEWISEIKAGVVAVVVAMMPMLALLLVTPLLNKAAPLVVGLWIFVAAWDVADMMLLQAANDQIYTVLDELRRSKMGLDMLTLAPTASMRAMSVLASSREYAMQIAVFIAGLFGISAYTLQSMGSKMTASLDEANKKAGDGALTPEGKGQLLGGMTQGLAEQTVHGQIRNIDSVASNSAMQTMSGVARTTGLSEAYGGLSPAASRMGAMDAASDAGRTLAMGSPGTALSTSATTTEQQIGAGRGTVDAATAQGTTVSSMTQGNTSVSTSAETGRAAGQLEAADGSLGGVKAQGQLISHDQTSQGVGSAKGHQQVASESGLSLSDMAQTTTYATGAYGLADGQRNIQMANQVGGWGDMTQIDSAQQDAARVTFSGNPDSAQDYHSTNLAEGINQQTGRKEVYAETGGLARANQAEGIAQAAGNAGKANALDASPNGLRGLVENGGLDAARQIGRGLTVNNIGQGFRSGMVSGQEEMAGTHAYDLLNGVGLSDREIAQGKANNHIPLSLNKDQAAVVNKNNPSIMNDQQLAAFQEKGSGTLLLDMAQDKAGNLMGTTRVSAGDSTSIDDSYNKDGSRSVNFNDTESRNIEKTSSTFTGNANSDRRALGDADYLNHLIGSNGLAQTGQDFANAGANVLGDVVSETVTRSVAMSGGGQASISAGKGAQGKSGASVGLSGGVETQSVDAAQVNSLRAHLAGAYNRAVEEGKGNGLEGDKLNAFVAQRASLAFKDAEKSVLSYGDRSKSDNSMIATQSAPLQPVNPTTQPGSSSFYGPAAAAQMMYNPSTDPAQQKANELSLQYASEHESKPSNPTTSQHVDAAISSGGFSEQDRPVLEENFAHAQNTLQTEAEQRGLPQQWVSANMGNYAGAVASAPAGQRQLAGAAALENAGVKTSGSMPPVPEGARQRSGGMPPVEQAKYKDGVPGF